jgi:hypothetical protein
MGFKELLTQIIVCSKSKNLSDESKYYESGVWHLTGERIAIWVAG